MSFFDFLKTKSTPKYKEEVLKIEISEVKKILNKFLRDHKYEDCSFKIKSIEILDREYENSFILKIVLTSNNTVVNNSRITIKDYFDSKCKDTSTDKLVIPVTGDVARSLSSQLSIENKPVKYVMRHKTKKRLFKIKVRDSEVTVTEDESLVVLRDGELVRVNPLEIKKTDGIIIDGQS